ncbi:MAG: type II secretion system F family protein [Methyloceanibacter sp.]|uniref:type II secretion system F family protein n=1 Tax=Methyloceanibacter sp. TaxID=1965321 RepID=UPI003D6D1153
MLSPEIVQLAAIALAALSVGGIVYVLVMPYLSDERKVSKRVATVAQGQTRARTRIGVPQPLQMRRKQVQDTIRDIEAKQKAKKRISLRTKLMRAGINIRPRVYYMLCAATGLLGGFIVLATGSSPLISLLAAIACGFGLPRWYVSRRLKLRQAKFLTEFANAIDIIVRGIKSGLPLTDCLQVIASETPEPVRSEFVDLVEQQKVGVPLSRAFERMSDRMPLQEVNFFAIVVAIQAQTGGNLAEALSNLSQVLRDRYRLQAKVKSFSAEAKASAMIIGALPPLVMGIVYVTSPDYISLLWTEKLGQMMLAAGAAWMLLGILVMRKMINFDY